MRGEEVQSFNGSRRYDPRIFKLPFSFLLLLLLCGAFREFFFHDRDVKVAAGLAFSENDPKFLK
jgi:hypothetical protein